MYLGLACAVQLHLQTCQPIRQTFQCCHPAPHLPQPLVQHTALRLRQQLHRHPQKMCVMDGRHVDRAVSEDSVPVAARLIGVLCADAYLPLSDVLNGLVHLLVKLFDLM